MSRTYQVNGNDAEGCSLVSREAFTIKEAKAEARIILTDKEYIESGLSRVKILCDQTGDCIEDYGV